MTKNLSKKLILSILSLVITFVTLGTTTFAWFTISNSAKVSNFNVHIETGDGIEISHNGVDAWFTTLNSDLINGASKILEEELTHLTSADGQKFYTMDMETGVVNTTPVAVGVGYIEFPLWFRAQTSQHIQWVKSSDNGAFTRSTTLGTWVADTAFSILPSDNSGTPTPVTIGTTKDIFAGAGLRVSMDQVAMSTGVSTGAVVAYEDPQNRLGDGAPFVAGTGIGATVAGSIDYWNQKNGFGPGHANEQLVAAAAGRVDTITNAELGAVDGFEIAKLEADVINPLWKFKGKVIVRIWLEGWDADSFNSLLDKIVNIELNFKGIA